MKKFIFTIIIITTIFITSLFSQDTIPNASLEYWHNNIPDYWKIEFDYPGPIPISFNLAEKSTDSQEGDFSLRLFTYTVPYVNITLPGAALIGELNSDFQISGGEQFTEKPTKLKYFYKYSPVSTDTLMTVVGLKRWDDIEQDTNLVAIGAYFTTEQQNEFVSIEIPLYYKENIAPDSIILGVVAGGAAPHQGTEAIIDNFEFIYSDYIIVPTIAQEPTNFTSNSFIANWLQIENANSYILSVAYDEEFTTYLPNYQDINVGLDTNYLIENIPNDYSLYYKVQVVYEDAGDYYYSFWSNAIGPVEFVGLKENTEKQTIYCVDNNIYFNNILGDIYIYDICGRLIDAFTNNNAFHSYSIDNQGVYIVKYADKHTKKIIIK